MSIPDRSQALYIHFGVAEALIDSVLDSISGTDFDTEHFRHRIDILKLGFKMTGADMKKVLNTDVPKRRCCKEA